MKYDAYICYSRRDFEITKQIVKALESYGIKCFFDIRDLKPGRDFQADTFKAIDNSGMVIVVLSQNAYNNDYLNREISNVDKKKVILPIVVDNTKLIDSFRLTHSTLPPYYWQVSGNKNVNSPVIKIIHTALGNTSSEQNTGDTKKQEIDNYVPHEIPIDIFISYRRIGGVDHARNIMLALKSVGYPNVFFDYNSIRDGVFNVQIIDAIYSCTDFILVISPSSLKNCSKKDDWVAREIRTALKYNKHIIPVIINDSFKSWPNDFPKDMASLKDLQFHKLLTDEYFEDSIEKLKSRLATKPIVAKSSTTLHQDTVTYKIKVDRKCRLLIDDEEVQILEAAKLTKISLPKAEYIRKVVDFENENIFKEDVLNLDKDKSEIITF